MSRQPDIVLLFAILGLTVFGFVMVGSASTVQAEQLTGDPFFFLKHQLLYGGTVGLSLFLVGYFVPYTFWKRFALPVMGLSLLLLILVFIPGLQVASGGSARWIGLGPVTLQPSEITKLAFILYLAALLDRKRGDIHDFQKSVVPFLLITAGISFLIILQPDIGTLFAISAIAGSMVFAAGFRLQHLALIGGLGLASFAILVSTASYRLSRIFTYLHPELDPQGIGYQVNQALLAVGSGGVFGLGFGRSRQKYLFLPEPASDSIFAIAAEELGFVRTIGFLFVYAIIAIRGYRVAAHAPDSFGKLLAVGITSWIVVQAFVNMGAILAIIPLTGIPLPFVSYGGSALAALLFAAGVLLNISTFSTQQK